MKIHHAVKILFSKLKRQARDRLGARRSLLIADVRPDAVDRRVPAGDDRATALALAATIAANSPVGVRNAKRAMREGGGLTLAEGLAAEDRAWHATAFSPDRAEGVAAFAEKRPPVWPTP